MGDDDELDYDLEKDEEDALLADPDNYDEDEDHQGETYEDHQGETFEDQNEETDDILDIDSNIALDETDDCNSSNYIFFLILFMYYRIYYQIYLIIFIYFKLTLPI